jgi:hypothetical protein
VVVQNAAESRPQSLCELLAGRKEVGGTAMSYPEELDTDDIEELASYIERRYPTDELRMCDTETIHFAYWDVSHLRVSSEFIDHIQQAGYRVLHAGVAIPPRRSTRRAWIECRKHEPDTDEYVAAEMNDNRNEDESDVYRVSCSHCEDEYTPDEAGSITIFGPGDVRYTCPRCGHGTNGLSPLINEE